MPRKKQYQWNSDATGDLDDKPSRSEMKRRSLALQELGEELTRLGPQEAKALDLPPDLQEALELYARIGDHEGRRRQMQFIGRVMRDLNPAPIRAAIDARKEKSAAATALLHTAEQWRDQLLAADEHALPALLAQLTDARTREDGQADKEEKAATAVPDGEELRKLALAAKKEAADNTAPHARRALFRALHRLLAS